MGAVSESKPLNHGELCELLDQDAFAADWLAHQDRIPLKLVVASFTRGFSIRADFVPILDAEGDFVCLAPREKAGLLVRLLNTYAPRVEEEDDRESEHP